MPAAPTAPAAPFRGPAADSRLGELLLDVLPIACSVGNALDLHHARWLCGTTLREGVRRPDGSLDSAGFLGGTANMIRNACRLQGLDAMRATGREGYEGTGRTTQLMRAANVGDEKRVRVLVAAGVNLNLVDVAGFSALHYASDNGHERLVELLLDGKYEGKGADVNLQTTSGGFTPLIRATLYHRVAVVRLLLERGANVALRDTDGCTALSIAHNKPAIHALLEAHGARE